MYRSPIIRALGIYAEAVSVDLYNVRRVVLIYLFGHVE